MILTIVVGILCAAGGVLLGRRFPSVSAAVAKATAAVQAGVVAEIKKV